MKKAASALVAIAIVVLGASMVAQQPATARETGHRPEAFQIGAVADRALDRLAVAAGRDQRPPFLMLPMGA